MICVSEAETDTYTIDLQVATKADNSSDADKHNTPREPAALFATLDLLLPPFLGLVHAVRC